MTSPAPSPTAAPLAGPVRRVRVGYLVCGLAALGLAGTWALWAAGLVGGAALSWLLPLVLLLAGVLGLLGLAVPPRQPAGDRRPDPDPDPTPTEEIR